MTRISLALCLTLAACGVPSALKPSEVTGKATGDLSPGARVGARQRGELMLAEVLRGDGDTYEVRFANHVTSKVKRADILPVAAPGSLKAGDRVLAPQQETDLWHADVARVDGGFAFVVFSGRTEQVKVPVDRVAPLPPGFCDARAGCSGSGPKQTDANGGDGVAAAAPTDPIDALHQSLKLGDSALVRLTEFGSSNHHEWRVGTVSGRNGDALVMKVPGLAEPKSAFRGELRPARAPKREPRPGMRALWHDQPGRYVEVYLATLGEGGDAEVNAYRDPSGRGGGGGEAVKLTKEQLTQLVAFDPADL